MKNFFLYFFVVCAHIRVKKKKHFCGYTRVYYKRARRDNEKTQRELLTFLLCKQAMTTLISRTDNQKERKLANYLHLIKKGTTLFICQ